MIAITEKGPLCRKRLKDDPCVRPDLARRREGSCEIDRGVQRIEAGQEVGEVGHPLRNVEFSAFVDGVGLAVAFRIPRISHRPDLVDVEADRSARRLELARSVVVEADLAAAAVPRPEGPREQSRATAVLSSSGSSRENERFAVGEKFGATREVRRGGRGSRATRSALVVARVLMESGALARA